MYVSVDAISAEGILTIVNSLRPDGMTASFLFGTDRTPLSGKQCWVYAIDSPNGNIWAVRIPAHIKHLPPAAITSTVEKEVSILKCLEQGGFAWSPKLVGYCTGFENPIAYPYIISTWIRGKPLHWTEDTPCRETRDKVLRQIGRIIVQLAECSQDQSAGTNAATYLTDIIDRKIIRVLDGGLPGIGLESCLLQRALVRMTSHPVVEPKLISHEDLDPSNIIVDEEYNIKGIIDWGFARRLPSQLAIGLPRFLGIEPSQLDEPLPPDVAKFSSTLLQPSSTLYQDRHCLTSHISSMVSEADGQNKATALRKLVLSVLSDANVDWRRLLFESVSSKGMHRWMADRQWLLPGLKGAPLDLNSSSLPTVIADELEVFLARNAENGGNAEQIKTRLHGALKTVV
ncbi:unnamed protein product [Clonostachys rosea f. rosea IK726]|uniref:Uncharacterized protein n=1 Tax=Clonostachys rosea f. rosea IK726 TaxID=1349383 RepID=A0ACA9U1C0_BIOOC|nr:unnamed protein product [Clonostachys rosea f. rosea IK726]